MDDRVQNYETFTVWMKDTLGVSMFQRVRVVGGGQIRLTRPGRLFLRLMGSGVGSDRF